jgi:hypothetical protein
MKVNIPSIYIKILLFWIAATAKFEQFCLNSGFQDIRIEFELNLESQIKNFVPNEL